MIYNDSLWHWHRVRQIDQWKKIHTFTYTWKLGIWQKIYCKINRLFLWIDYLTSGYRRIANWDKIILLHTCIICDILEFTNVTSYCIVRKYFFKTKLLLIGLPGMKLASCIGAWKQAFSTALDIDPCFTTRFGLRPSLAQYPLWEKG